MTAIVRVARAIVAAADKMGLPVCATIRSGVGKDLWINLHNASRKHLDGTYELPVQQVLGRVLRSGDTFLDIGSNIGFFSLIAARLVGAEGRVFAVEPVPENIRCILTNAKVNHFKNIETVELAIDRTDRVRELLLARHSGGATLSRADTPRDFRGRICVRAATVDNLLKSDEIDVPHVVKIDVEGAEVDVLEGMRDTLQRHRPKVIFEVDAETPDRAQAKFEALVERLHAFGYLVERLEAAYGDLQWAVIHGLAEPLPIEETAWEEMAETVQ